MRLIRPLAVALVSLALSACATQLPPRVPSPWELPRPPKAKPKPPPVVEQPPQPVPPVTFELASLPGWAQEDHAGAYAAYLQTCHVARSPDYAAVCARARASGPLGAEAARRFFELNFRAAPSPPPGLLTAYFAPEYEARFSRQGDFTAPVRPRPADLPADGRPYYDRTVIEATPEARPLAWMRPEDLFFLQIQGSGTLRLPDRRLKVLYDSHNGQPFVGIAAPLRDQGLLPADNTSGEAIRRWLADHRGPEADAIMRLNPRYVFFRTAPDDGLDPAGAAGVPLPAGRAIAVDLSRHVLGEPFWIEASAPVLSGAFPRYSRLVMALDTGGAIKGDARADLYIGRGEAAGLEAGRVKHTLSLYRLIPVVR